MKEKEVRLHENSGEQGFHYYVKHFFDSITKAVKDTSENFYAESKSTTKTIEELNYSFQLNILDFLKKIGVLLGSSIRLLAKVLAKQNENQLRLYHDLDSDR